MTRDPKLSWARPHARRRLLLKRGAAGSGALAAAALGSGTISPLVRSQVVAAGVPVRADDQAFWFGFIGDTPYSRLEEGSLRQVLAAMAAEPLEFVLHAGDVKSRTESCGDDLLSNRLDLLDQCPHPLILTPGDNDWTDCTDNPLNWPVTADLRRLERLQWLRLNAYRHPHSLGRRRMSLQQQGAGTQELAGETRMRAALPENLRWRIGSLQFCTLHVVGSNNAPRQAPELERAWLLRQEANGAWLNETVELAIRDNAQGLVIALHANMRFEAGRGDGWERMRQLVIAAAVAFDGPVLLLHGDTHRFRSDRLLLRSHGLANFRRVECYGSPFSASWVQIRWEPSLARRGATVESDPFHVTTRELP